MCRIKIKQFKIKKRTCTNKLKMLMKPADNVEFLAHKVKNKHNLTAVTL